VLVCLIFRLFESFGGLIQTSVGRRWGCGGALESVGVGQEGLVEGGLAEWRACLRRAVVDAVWGHVADARVLMLVVVPGEEGWTVGGRRLEAAEARGEVGPVLHGLELRLRVRVVVGDVRAAVALGTSRSTSKAATGLERMLAAAIGVQRQHAGLDVVPAHGLGDQLLGEFRALALGDEPAHDEAAEDVQDHVQVEVRPLGRPLELGDVPRPDLVGRDGQQLGLGVGRVGELVAPLARSRRGASNRYMVRTEPR
jgi:hypothetical protein